MDPAELARIAEIDRSEHITREYVYRNGALESRDVDVRAARWSPTGDDEDSVAGHIAAWQPILDRGGALIGGFDDALLVGFAIYRPRLEADMGNLAALYVSRGHRGAGVGERLAAEVARLARADGARRLYVSATPTVSTVDFYRGLGFAPTDHPDEALFEAEPRDIHMVLEL